MQKILILLILVLTHTSTASAALVFSNVPSGTVGNPVSVTVTIDSPADLDADTLGYPFWAVEIWGQISSGLLGTNCAAITDASGVYTFSGTVPLDSYDTVAIIGTADCTGVGGGEVITSAANFTVTETPVGGGGYFPVSGFINKENGTNVILNSLIDFGTALLAVLGVILGLGLGYLIFKFGWKRLTQDKSLMIGGFYLRNTPYKGYNRWRSKSWNMKHTM